MDNWKNFIKGIYDTKPEYLFYIVEVKNSSISIDRNLKYFSEKYKLNALQIVKNIRYSFVKDNIKIINAVEFLESLEILFKLKLI